MKASINLAREMKMDGVVLGVLCDDYSVDIERTKELAQWASPMKVTFHRAFDECRDLLQGLEDVIETGVARVLTSGGAPDASLGRDMLRTLVALAGNRIVILPGAGITPENFAVLAQATGAKEFHAGLGNVLSYKSKDLPRFQGEVQELARIRETASEN